jgi:glycosyltransferase involved in cell wall biosynthesis
LRQHPELNQRLFWPQGVSDELLTHIYGNSDCLIAASWGEGFGLPLIEAAHHGLPVLARDLPVFREVANDNATYFTANDSQGLADAILQWLQNPSQRTSATPDTAMTWLQSVAQLNQALWVSNENQ